MTVQIRNLDAKPAKITDEELAALGAGLRGEVALKGEPGYDEARTLWNATVNRKPGIVVRARGSADVQAAVNLAQEKRLLISVRSGGHQIAGHAVADGALLLDLSQMRSVRVDPMTRTAWVEPGATLGDVDKETAAHGLALPMGINSTTGIAGLTLGGGFGWLTRKYGMTIDNLISADVVTADGKRLRASENDHPDLFWAIRGGGGNFGIVTAFEFRLHQVGPEVLAGLIVYPYAEAGRLLREYRRITADAPDDLTIWTVFRKAPPLPFLPAEWHGREVFVIAACYAGDPAKGEAALAPLRRLGEPIADVIGPSPLAGWQAAFDPLLAPGARNYWKSHDFLDLPDALIDILAGALSSSPSPNCEIFVAHVGGAMARVRPEATAYPQRASHFIMNIHTRWDKAKQDDECRRWARSIFDKTAPHATGTAYVNFMPEDEPDRITGVYGDNMQRLSEVKAKYDASNLFRLNHNIQPAREMAAAE
ncbi:6-hydroxy-D-nicotine oxidase [Defluviimonas aquaemixtae]|uniref:6-hydroxy-D-nicotine oxidase n=1 Tax=Albidovulum aquaemixtae TaxID=1542388 RepID=A0A2R8B471_9RHOB|nr:FAD-binding oxidoreductase [Defluviimonas aquaemixtae]SPH17418.1 6-hydroxy-D-nicotine oxidase [Defluviimonas aquaemixtae]